MNQVDQIARFKPRIQSSEDIARQDYVIKTCSSRD